MDLLVPDDFSQPAGAHQKVVQGFFTLLAEDEKGALVRLDRGLPGHAHALARAGSVLYAARARDGSPWRAIRPASDADRLQRFRRPAYLDGLAVGCCGAPARYLSIYDEASGRFFDLGVLPEAAQASAQGPLVHFFMCPRCGQSCTRPL